MPEALINRVVVCGTGVQGSMIAFRCAVWGKGVILFDVDRQALERAMAKIQVWLRDAVAEGKLSDRGGREARRRITACDGLSTALAGADLVIENVPERLELKRAVWREIDALAPPQALLTTNSSSLRSSDIGADVGRKDRTFNLNFMTPTEDDLVEVMWNSETSAATRDAALAFLRSIGSIPIVTRKEIKGFSLNRVWRAMKKECLKLWAEGYIDPHDLDRAFMLEWRTPYGPFALMDKVGLDVVRDIERSYFRESGDGADVPPEALDEMIAHGHLGEKSGHGFYDYPNPAYERADFLRGAHGDEAS